MGRGEMEGGDGVRKRKDEEGLGEDKSRGGGEERREGVDSEGDFNARTGERGAIEEREEGRERVSKDKLINKQGEELVRWVEEERWGIINGVKE